MQSEIELSAEPKQEEDLGKAFALKKLALEIAELERPWWKRPTYILAALPTLLAVIALSVGFINGYFSAQLTKLENQKHDLEVQVKEFEGKRDELHREYDKAMQELEQTREQLRNTQKQMAEVNDKYAVLASILGIDSHVLRRAFDSVNKNVR